MNELIIAADAAEACVFAGNIYQNEGQHEAAIGRFLLALSYRPRDLDCLLGLGYCYGMLEMYWTAEQYLLQAAGFHKASDQPYLSLARLYWGQWNYLKAIAYAKKALTLNPKNSDTMYMIGILFREWSEQSFSWGKLRHALAYQVATTQENPNHLDSFVEQAYLYCEFGKWRDAERMLLVLTSDFPHKFLVWYNLGVARLHRSRYGKALEAYRRAAELNPEDADARAGIDLAFRKLVVYN